MTDREENLLALCRTTLVWLRSLPDEVRQSNSLETLLNTIIADADRAREAE